MGAHGGSLTYLGLACKALSTSAGIWCVNCITAHHTTTASMPMPWRLDGNRD